MRVLLLCLALLGVASAFHRFNRLPVANNAQTRSSSRAQLFMRKRPVSLMRGKTQVVLTQDVPSVGKADTVNTVRSGFYLNYLLPRGLATLANAESLARVEANAARNAEEAAAALEQATSIKEKLEGIKTFKVAKKVGENDSIYGSVTIPELLAAIEDASGLTLGTPKIDMESVNSVGTFDFTVSLHAEVAAALQLEVVAEE